MHLQIFAIKEFQESLLIIDFFKRGRGLLQKWERSFQVFLDARETSRRRIVNVLLLRITCLSFESKTRGQIQLSLDILVYLYFQDFDSVQSFHHALVKRSAFITKHILQSLCWNTFKSFIELFYHSTKNLSFLHEVAIIGLGCLQ